MVDDKRTIIITGGNAGLGFECAKALANSKKWHIVVASRNMDRVSESIQTLRDSQSDLAVDGMLLDLSSLDSVRNFVSSLKRSKFPPLHAVICNAGIQVAQDGKTSDGFEVTFGVNHLGHYLLVHLLTDVIQPNGRIVFVSSGTHIPDHKLARLFRVPVPKYTTAMNLAFPEQAAPDDRIEDTRQRYSTSKLCNVLAAYELDRQLKKAGKIISVFAINPGLMPGTELTRDYPILLRRMFFVVVKLMSNWNTGIRAANISGEHLARLVTDPALNNKSGLYFDGADEDKSSPDSYDIAKARDLWNTSSKLCKLLSNETVLPVEI